MIYLHPPYHTFEGVTVLSDYHDPYQYYYLPNRPHLAVDNGRPAIRLLALKANLDELKPEEEDMAGFFYFDTTLAWPDETLKKVAKKIQAIENLERLPRLSPLLYKSGSVRLIFLDKVTSPADGSAASPATTDPPAEPSRWVIKLESSGVPSLYGENRAVFSAVLTKEATQLVYNAFDGFMPAGVVYDLTFVGMQRAFNVHVKADWEQIYHFMKTQWSTDLVFFTLDIEHIVSTMIDRKLISMTASLEGMGEEGMENEFNAVRKELTEFVTDKFFKPVVHPDKQDADKTIEGRIMDAARTLRNVSLLLPSVGYSRRELDMTEIQSIDIDYTVARAVERKIAPQAHISMFFEDFQLKKEQVATVVNGADDFWKTVDFQVLANVAFDEDGIFGVGVDVALGADSALALSGQPTATWSAMLNKSNPSFKKSSWYDPEAQLQHAYRYKAIFSSGSIPGESPELDSGWRPTAGNVLVVSPSELYQRRQVEFQLMRTFPSDLFPQVSVELRYVEPSSGWTYHDSAVIDSTSPRTLFKFRIRRNAPLAVEYRCQFAQSHGSMSNGEWQRTDSDLVLVTDPRSNIFRVNILVAGERSKIQELLINLRYDDPADGHAEEKFIRLNQTNINEPQEWIFSPSDSRQHRYTYSVLLMDVDGNLTELGPMQEEKNSLPIGNIYFKKWEVRPELAGPPLASNGLEKILLSLRYVDEDNGVVSEKQMIFVQPGKGEVWPLQLKNPSLRSYVYEIRYVMQNGFELKVGPMHGSDTFLIVSSVPPA